MEALLKQLRDAQYQLNESREQGCLHEYIDDQHTDLNQVFNQSILLLNALLNTQRSADAA